MTMSWLPSFHHAFLAWDLPIDIDFKHTLAFCTSWEALEWLSPFPTCSDRKEASTQDTAWVRAVEHWNALNFPAGPF